MSPHKPRCNVFWTSVFLLALISSLLFSRHIRRTQHLVEPAPLLAHAPDTILWAWETPEDLRALSPEKIGIAFLSRELLLGATPQLRLRHQPLLVPPNAFLIAVVRIETSAQFHPESASIPDLANKILTALDAPNIRALQIDFDATASQRTFYRSLLTDLRKRLPSTTPLSITALTSWCGSDSWLHSFPINEAVPMFFRMGGPAVTRAIAPRSTANIAEPLCAGSVGIATDEAWPTIAPAQRVYVFRYGSWSAEDVAHANANGYRQLQAAPPTR